MPTRLTAMRSWFFLLVLSVFLSCSVDTPSDPSVLLEFNLEDVSARSPDLSSYSEESPLGAPGLLLQASDKASIVLAGNTEEVPWSEARYLVADMLNPNEYSAIIEFHFFREGQPDKARISSKMGLLPGLPTRVTLPLDLLDGQEFFMGRQARRLKGVMRGRRLEPGEIDRVEFQFGPFNSEFRPTLWVSRLALTTEEPPPLPPVKPIVDSLGQWTEKEWPGKVADVEELKSKLGSLYEENLQATFPDSWSSYGGWKGKRFRSSGFFRTEKEGDRWWLVDPEGYAFFSVGMDCVRPHSAGPVQGMEELHEWLPPSEGEFAAAYSSTRNLTHFSFLTANLIRAFGSEWENRWRELSRGLLIHWRFNTVANWSDLGFARESRLPYVIPMRGFPSTQLRLYRDFPDVFSPEYEEASEQFALQAEEFKEDSFLIGYFMDNEPEWVFGGANPAEEMLATAQPSATRKELVRWLTERYQNDIQALAGAWNHEFVSFTELEETALRDAASFSERAEADLEEFSEWMVDRYIALPSRALKAVDPNHLNLGIRYSSISTELCYRGGDSFDVFSLNSYSVVPNADVIAEITRRTGRPVMIGEFHHGAIDRGLPSTGIRGVASQAERGTAYRYYVEQGAAMPSVVGIHFFQLNDQPVLGRFDGENYNIGLVDICNLPHLEMTGPVTETNSRIYDVVSGAVEAFSQKAKEIPAIYF